jgi:hypothetical protein
MEEVTFVSSVAQTLDGFCYTISVYRKTGGFFAFWECGQCGDQDAPLIPAPDRDAAIGECKKLINGHHAGRHAPTEKISPATMC